MRWFKQHLNLTYTLCLMVGLIPLILIGFVRNSGLGYAVWAAILFLASWWTLEQKGRSLSYMWLVGFVPVVGIPLLLCLSDKKQDTTQLSEKKESGTSELKGTVEDCSHLVGTKCSVTGSICYWLDHRGVSRCTVKLVFNC